MFEFINGFGALQGLILCGVFLLARGRGPANLLIATLVLVISLRPFQSLLITSGYFHEHPRFALVLSHLGFTWGPLLYLYARALTRQSLSLRSLWHFLPFALLMVGLLPYFLQSEQNQRLLLDYLWYDPGQSLADARFAAQLPWFWRVWLEYNLEGSLFCVHFGAYCGLVLLQIRRSNERLQLHYSSLEAIDLRWLTQLTLCCIAYLVLFLVLNRIPRVLLGSGEMDLQLPYLFLVVLIYLIALVAMFRPSLVHGVQHALDTMQDRPSASESPATNGEESEKEREEPGAKKYRRSSLSLADSQRFKKQLMDVMQDEALYLDSELTLPDLARAAGLTPHQVSQVLNEQMRQNFFSFVNNYRIQLARELLLEPKKKSTAIVDLAMEVGFKSKSSFYDAFKKATGMTPTQYRQANQ